MYVLTIALPPNFVPIKSLHLHGDPISLATTGWLDGWMAGWLDGVAEILPITKQTNSVAT